MDLVFYKLRLKLAEWLLMIVLNNEIEIVTDTKKERGKHYRALWIMMNGKISLLTYWVVLTTKRRDGRTYIKLLKKS